MGNKKIERVEIYELVDGVSTLKEVVENEIEAPTQEELIAEKEAELLKMYQELEALKSQNS